MNLPEGKRVHDASISLGFLKPDDHWSCIAHLSVEDMLKSVVIEEKKFKHSPMVGADNPLEPKFLCQQELWSFVASLLRISSTSS